MVVFGQWVFPIVDHLLLSFGSGVGIIVSPNAIAPGPQRHNMPPRRTRSPVLRLWNDVVVFSRLFKTGRHVGIGFGGAAGLSYLFSESYQNMNNSSESYQNMFSNNSLLSYQNMFPQQQLQSICCLFQEPTCFSAIFTASHLLPIQGSSLPHVAFLWVDCMFPPLSRKTSRGATRPFLHRKPLDSPIFFNVLS